MMTAIFEQFPELKAAEPALRAACDRLTDCFRHGGKLLVCGNGGSAADSEHIVGELQKGFMKKRPLSEEKKAALGEIGERLQGGLPAISLVCSAAILSAVANDLGGDLVYAQQVMALGREGDVLLGISTSGNAENICAAFAAAKAQGMTCIALTGARDSRMSALADITVRTPSTLTPVVQQYHLPLYHALCAEVEKRFFAE